MKHLKYMAYGFCKLSLIGAAIGAFFAVFINYPIITLAVIVGPLILLWMYATGYEHFTGEDFGA